MSLSVPFMIKRNVCACGCEGIKHIYNAYEEMFVNNGYGRGYGGGGNDLALLYNASDDEEMYDSDGDLIAPVTKKARVGDAAPEEEKKERIPTVFRQRPGYTDSHRFYADYDLMPNLHAGGAYHKLSWAARKGSYKLINEDNATEYDFEQYRDDQALCKYHLVHADHNFGTWGMEKGIDGEYPYKPYVKTSHTHNADFSMVPEQCCGRHLKVLCWLPDKLNAVAKQDSILRQRKHSNPVFIDNLGVPCIIHVASHIVNNPVYKLRKFFHGGSNINNVVGLTGVLFMKRMARKFAAGWLHVMSFMTEHEVAVFAHCFSSKMCGVYGVLPAAYEASSTKVRDVAGVLHRGRLTYDLTNFCNRHANRAEQLLKNAENMSMLLGSHITQARKALVRPPHRTDNEEKKNDFGVHPLAFADEMDAAIHVSTHSKELMSIFTLQSFVYVSCDEDEDTALATRGGLMAWHGKRLHHIDSWLARDKCSSAYSLMLVLASGDCALHAAIKNDAFEEEFVSWLQGGVFCGTGVSASVTQFVVQFSNSFFAGVEVMVDRLWTLMHSTASMMKVDMFRGCMCPPMLRNGAFHAITYMGGDDSPIKVKYPELAD